MHSKVTLLSLTLLASTNVYAAEKPTPSILSKCLSAKTGWYPDHYMYSEIEEGAPVNEVSYPLGLTPLHLATIKNHPQSIDLLLKKGAKPEEQDIAGNTALHHWAHSNYTGTIMSNQDERSLHILAALLKHSPQLVTAQNHDMDFPLDLFLKRLIGGTSETSPDYVAAKMLLDHKAPAHVRSVYKIMVNSVKSFDAIAQLLTDHAKLINPPADAPVVELHSHLFWPTTSSVWPAYPRTAKATEDEEFEAIEKRVKEETE